MEELAAGDVTLHAGDAVQVLAGMPAASVDAVVTDPPYGLEFMGQDWDRPWAVGTAASGLADGADRLPGPVHGDNRNPTCGTCGGRARGARRCTCEAPAWKPTGDTRDSRTGRGARVLSERADELTPKGQAHSTSSGPYIAAGVDSVRVAGPAFQAWCTTWAAELLRVTKPGGHALVFGGSRTWHRLAVALEDAGWEIRDTITWLYGSGFPKSLDVGKAIDRAAGATREVVGQRSDGRYASGFSEAAKKALGSAVAAESATGFSGEVGQITVPATAAAATWEGWGTALKPGFVPIIVARRPLAGTVAANVQEYGTGALNIAGCRTPMDPADRAEAEGKNRHADFGSGPRSNAVYNPDAGRDRAEQGNWSGDAGRWPTNVILTHAPGCNGACVPGCPVADLDRQSGVSKSTGGRIGKLPAGDLRYGPQGQAVAGDPGFGDTGGASRFFPRFRYAAKAGDDERPSYYRFPCDCEPCPTSPAADPSPQRDIDGSRSTAAAAPAISAALSATSKCAECGALAQRMEHATVKPLDLMRWLVRLVTPSGALILDPFAGSGTTGQAAVLEGRRAVLIERHPDYLPLIRARLAAPQAPALF